MEDMDTGEDTGKMSILVNKNSEVLNAAEALLEDLPSVEIPLTHRHTTGLYIREVLIPKGTILTTRIHKTEHPFFLMQGEVSVGSDMDGSQRLKAPYVGITQPGTRRIIYAHEDTIWVTVHATNEIDPDVIAEEITEQPDNPFVDTSLPRFNTWKMENSPSLILRKEEALQ